MSKWLRPIRGAIGMGLTWAAAWGIAGAVPRWLFGFNTDAPLPLIFAVIGFFAGVIFSAVLSQTERGRELDQLSLPRFAGWGAISGFLLSALFARAASLGMGDAFAIVPTFTVACAACASGSLALARRAERRQLPDSRADAARAELANQEKRKLR
ncbi:MAG: hypothetical protein ACJ79J_01670 [Gemmatimonadaceae bacterium]|jgi:FtsH-binding integral membrane protein